MNQIKSNYNTIISRIPYMVFFLASFIYFGFFETIYSFFRKSPRFSFFIWFSAWNLHQPGGVSSLAWQIISTFYFYPLAGAIILSALLTLIVILISEIIFVLSGHYSKVVSLIIGATLFYLQTDYRLLLFIYSGYYCNWLSSGLYWSICIPERMGSCNNCSFTYLCHRRFCMDFPVNRNIIFRLW